MFGSVLVYLVFLETVLEDVLHDQAASLAQCNFMPHTAQSLIDVAHDLRWRVAPPELKELLPNVARVAVDDGLWNAAKKLVYHSRLVLFRDAVEGLLDDVAAECIHAQSKGIAADGLSDGDNLIVRAMLKAALYEEVAEAIDH